MLWRALEVRGVSALGLAPQYRRGK